MPGAKGNGGEKEVAAILKGWWSSLEPDVSFCRTPSSGGWSHGRDKAAFNAAGDIMTSSSSFPFCVEVKRREGWDIDQLKSKRPSSPVWPWWRQSQIDAKRMTSKKLPMLVFRKNRQPWHVWIPINSIKTEMSKCLLWMPNTQWQVSQLAAVQYGAVAPIGFMFDHLTKIPPKLLLECLL